MSVCLSVSPFMTSVRRTVHNLIGSVGTFQTLNFPGKCATSLVQQEIFRLLNFSGACICAFAGACVHMSLTVQHQKMSTCAYACSWYNKLRTCYYSSIREVVTFFYFLKVTIPVFFSKVGVSSLLATFCVPYPNGANLILGGPDRPHLQGRVAGEVRAAGEQPRVLQGPHSLLVGHSPPQGEGWGPQ